MLRDVEARVRVGDRAVLLVSWIGFVAMPFDEWRRKSISHCPSYSIGSILIVGRRDSCVCSLSSTASEILSTITGLEVRIPGEESRKGHDGQPGWTDGQGSDGYRGEGYRHWLIRRRTSEEVRRRCFQWVGRFDAVSVNGSSILDR